MPIFEYKAKKGATETVSGRIQAQNQNEAVELIHRLGLLPVMVEEEAGVARAHRPLPKKRIKGKELLVFSRQLAHLLKAGIPILQALTILSQQTQTPYFREVIVSLGRNIKDGRSFSEALSAYPHIFSSFYIAMMKAGEEGGNLREVLLRISEYQQTQEEIYSKVRTAMAYPLLMAIVGIGTVFFILTFVMPRITGLFSATGETLPFVTRMLMEISDFLAIWWVGIILVIGIVVYAVIQWGRTVQGRKAFSQFILNLPVLGELNLKVEIARFCRTLGLLLKNGVSLIKGLQIALPILHNEIIKSELARCQRDLEGGSSWGSSLKALRIVPPMVTNLISVGEESGLLEETLSDIADNYEQETTETIKTATTILEPAMILFVGLIIGLIVVAMLLPIFQVDILAQ